MNITSYLPQSRRLWSIALPMMLANSSIAVFGLIDAAVVGHLEHEAYLAGVALASVLFDFLYWGVTFLRMGTTGVIAQAYGAKKLADCRQALFEALLIALLLAMLILICRQAVMGVGLSMLEGSATARVQAEAYFKIKIWGAPGVLMTMVMMGWLIGVQQASTVLKLTAVTSLVNAGLDILLVFGLDMGVEGVAYAALTSAYLSAGLGVYFCFGILKNHGVSLRVKLPDLGRLQRFVSLNLNILVRTLCLISAFALFTRAGAKQGDTVLAANAVLLSFQMLLALSLDGFANALEVLVGEAIGANDRGSFLSNVKIGTAWSVLAAALFALAYLVFGRGLISLLTDIPAVAGTANEYLPWMVLSPLVAVWCFIFDGVFIGATEGSAMRNSMMFALFIVFIPALLLLGEHGNHGLWAAFMMFFAARGASMIGLFFWIEQRRGFILARG